MHLLSVITILAQEQTSEAKDLYPHVAELIVGAVGFLVLFLRSPGPTPPSPARPWSIAIARSCR